MTNRGGVHAICTLPYLYSEIQVPNIKLLMLLLVKNN